MAKSIKRKPAWLKMTIPGGSKYVRLKKTILDLGLHTVCIEAKCPNAGECFNSGTATFLIMGSNCSRNCRYCSVNNGKPDLIDPEEPKKIAEAVSVLGLDYAVITSVTRDDIPDGGADFFSQVIKETKRKNPSCRVEVLVPDFKDSLISSVKTLVMAEPDVINHNIEVVKRLYKKLRPSGNYDISLKLLSLASESKIPIKSGLMVGFGETREDIKSTLDDLINTGCSILTVGQYLQSSVRGFNVIKYYTPDEFSEISIMAKKTGFKKVLSGPMVRSSYHASEIHSKINI